MKTGRSLLLRSGMLLLLAALAILCGFYSFILLEYNRILSLLCSIGYVLSWAAYTVLARKMGLWNLLPLLISCITMLILLEVLLLTYSTARLPVFLLLLSGAAAIPTLYPLLGFSGIDGLPISVFAVVFLLISAAWCVLSAQALHRKKPKGKKSVSPDASEISE